MKKVDPTWIRVVAAIVATNPSSYGWSMKVRTAPDTLFDGEKRPHNSDEIVLDTWGPRGGWTFKPFHADGRQVVKRLKKWAADNMPPEALAQFEEAVQ